MSQGTTHLYENVPRSKQELPNQPSELTSVGDIIKGTTVYLQVGNGMRRGRVVYMTVPHKETEPYAVVEMTKQDGDRMWNGMHKGYHVYTPRNGVITTFVPASDVTTHAPEDFQCTTSYASVGGANMWSVQSHLASQAHKTDTSRVARSTTAASAAAPSRSEAATGKGAAATIPGASTLAEPTCFILLVDKEVQVSASDSLLNWRHTPSSSRILKGSLLQGHEVHVGMVGGLSYGDVVKGSKRADVKRYVVKPLNGDMQFECSSWEIGRITGLERDLLRALSTNLDRFNIYQDKNLLPYALGLKEGSLVKVKHRNDSTSPYEEVAAIVRYIGPLSVTEMETQFGLELRDDAYRGQGMSDGVFGKCRYFKTEPDCALFVPISKLVPPSMSQGTTHLYENVPGSKQELPNQPSEPTSVGDIKEGMTVYLQVGNGTRRGRVVYMTVPFKETEPYAVVEMPKQDGDQMWNGMHRGYHVFTPRNEVFTKFVPTNNLTTLAREEYQDLYTKDPSPSLPSKVKSEEKKPSEPSWTANIKPPRKTLAPYGSSKKLEKGSHKPSGGRCDASESFYPASQARKTDTHQDSSDDLQFASRHSGEGSKSKRKSFSVFVNKMKNKWNSGSKDEETTKTPWYTENYDGPGDVARRSYLDTSFLEEDVVEEVVKTIYRDWRTVGLSLYLSREEMDRIAADCETEKERTVDMLRAWQRKRTGFDKITRLAEACRSCHFDELANELEQGLDETLLCKIASGIPPEKARPFGTFLNFSNEELNLIDTKAPHTLTRVRIMLAKWRTRQSHNSDKIMLLSNALQSCGFRQLALEVARGLDDDIMLLFAVQIGHNWKILATMLRLDVKDIQQLEDFSEDKQPYQMLMLWRRRQDRSVDVLGALAKGLRESGLPDLAYDLVQGVTDEMLGKLAVMIGDKWEAVAQCLGFNEEELKELKSDRNAETVTITIMLTKWRERHDYTRDRFGFLMEALRACGLGNIADSFEEDRRRLEQSKKVAPSAETEESPGYAKDKDRLERNLDREILVKVSQHVNFRELCRVIDFPTEDAFYIKKSYRRNELRVFQVLDSWKRRGDGGNRSISELLQVLAHLGCKPAVIDEIIRKDAADDKEEVNPMKQLQAEYTNFNFPSLPDEPQDEPCYPDLEVNSMVEVKPSDKTLFGVIRWIGVPVGSKSSKPVAGIELESSIDHGATDGTFNKQHYFQCEPNKAIFVYLSKCRPDSRFLSQAQTFSSTKRQTSQDFGGFASPLVEGFIDPPLRLRPEFVGMRKGIQGDQNSCYLDSTLFSMFAYNGVFDPLLRHMQGQGNLQEYEKVQKTLRESIVNPLRKNGFVRADRILQLREHLDQLGTTKGLMTEKKDPEEFLHTLLSEVFKSRTLLKIRHGANKEVDESNIHQIFLEKDESFTLPTVEQLLLQSFQEHDLKLVETPSCLIVQMPRCDKDYKMCNRILPSFQLDVTDIIEGYPRQCTVCGILATFECSECKSEEALADTTHIKNYCDSCFNRMHIGTHREHHQPTLLTIPDYFLKEFLSKTRGKGFSEEEVDKHRQRLLTPKLMDLFAVICIRTSHYVAFVKAGREKDSEWVFFDSMADRQGDQQGYYIPQITHLKDFRKLVDVDHIKARIEAKQLTEIMERLLGDAYICMYSEKLHTGAALHSVGISVEDFGGFASPLVEGFIDPPALLRREFVGMQKGIQGYRNSCYLDTTLFSMFAYNGVFDPHLRRTQGQGDLQEYEKAQKTLRESIVNPLRKNGFVRADRILQLREHLDQLGTTKGLMSEKKDPEEFLHTLLSEVFKSQPLLKIRHGANQAVDESNIYQLFLDKDESFTLPTVEQLLLQSFQEHDLKLVEAPSCLIVQMPRFGKDYKMYNRILPSPQLDITNIIEEYPRQCRVCGTLAIFECSECKTEEALEDTTLIKNYCVNCFLFMHEGTHPEHHKPTTLTVPDHFIKEFFSKTMDKGFSELLVDEHRQRLLTPKMMDLFAVICIRTSHYVAFVKAGKEKDSEWVFFDSMADRQGDQQDYYIPQITHLKDFRKWVDMGHIKARIEAKQLTEITERLLGDAYIYMYSDSEQCRQTYA